MDIAMKSSVSLAGAFVAWSGLQRFRDLCMLQVLLEFLA